MKSKIFSTLSIAVLALVLMTPASGICQWPTKQLSIVVPYGAGGTTDRVMRSFAPFLEKELKVPVIVVNRPGGGGTVGTKAHILNDPDDGSFVLYTIEPYLSGAIFKKALNFDDVDFFGLNYNSPQGLFVQSDSPYKTAQDLFKAIKDAPGKISISVIPNSWSRVANALLEERLGAKIKEIPYEGGGKQRLAVIKNEVNFTITEVYGTLAAAAQDVRCLAVFEDERLPEIPEVPTINELMKEIGGKEIPPLRNTRFFIVKKGFKEKYPDRWEMLTAAMAKAATNPEFVQLMATQKLEAIWEDPNSTRKKIEKSHEVLRPFASFWQGSK
jgi:putative tricarboxylic transport membrane protein